MACYTIAFSHSLWSGDSHPLAQFMYNFTHSLQIIHGYKRTYDTILYINQNINHFTYFITFFLVSFYVEYFKYWEWVGEGSTQQFIVLPFF